jgi:hypothetical protein
MDRSILDTTKSWVYLLGLDEQNQGDKVFFVQTTKYNVYKIKMIYNFKKSICLCKKNTIKNKIN